MFPAGEAVSGRPGAQPPGEPAAQAGGGAGQAAERGHLGGVDFRAAGEGEHGGVRLLPFRELRRDGGQGGKEDDRTGVGAFCQQAESSSWRRGRAG